jgi:ABC-type transport system involved in multi-copper enzyme maturation permease subunit
MAEIMNLVLSPLAGPECRRALGRGWLILVRVLAALAMAGTTLVIIWFWWISQASDSAFLPYAILRYGLATVEGMLVTIALVLGPAVLAGSIAGERERGVMGLLLTTRVSAREIIVGRLTGKLTQVAMVLLAGVPAMVSFFALSGMDWRTFALLLGLPAAVALGGGGLAVLASTVSRRGRDALLTVYMVDVLFLLSPLSGMIGWTTVDLAWLGTLNPFLCLSALIWDEAPVPALISSGTWLAIGLIATAVAAWRLRPACLRPLEGERVGRRGKRYSHVPPVDARRPMLWKELFIERAGALGGPGWWLGALLVLLLGGAGLTLLGIMIASLWIGDAWSGAGRTLMAAIAGSAAIVTALIEWAVGLRAAVTISSERERGTWDALLTSPLGGREIVWAKVWGSLHALRWLFAATFLAWSIAGFFDALDSGGEALRMIGTSLRELLWASPGESLHALRWLVAAGFLARSIATVCGVLLESDYLVRIIGTTVLAAFMAAVGVRTSLSAPTATRAMTITIGVWLGASLTATFLAAIIVGVLFVVGMATVALATMGSFNVSPVWIGPVLTFIWPATRYGIYVAATLMLVADTGLRFDRIAGRMTAGRVATAVDALIHGKTHDPWPPPLDDFSRADGAVMATTPPASTPT